MEKYLKPQRLSFGAGGLRIVKALTH